VYYNIYTELQKMNNLPDIVHFISRCVNIILSHISKNTFNQKKLYCNVLKSSQNQLQKYAIKMRIFIKKN